MKITEVLNEFKIIDIGKSTDFCERQRVVKPFELVMSLITGLGDKTVDSISDLHRYFTGLTYTDVQYKPFHNQLNKPEFLDLMKQLMGMAMGNWQQQILGTDVSLSAFKRIVAQDGSSFAEHDDLKETFKGRYTTISPAAVKWHVSWDITWFCFLLNSSNTKSHTCPFLNNGTSVIDRNMFNLYFEHYQFCCID